MKIALLGAGGHARSCLEVLRDRNDIEVVGLLDPHVKPGSIVDGYPVLGDDSALSDLDPHDTWILVAVGQTGSSEQRRSLFHLTQSKGFKSPVVVSEHAVVSASTVIGEGTIVMQMAVVNAGSRIGNNVIVNTLALLEHDTVVGSHTHISTGALVNGGCKVGTDSLIGSGAILLHDVCVCNETIIGAGAIVTHDIDVPGTYVGNPARRIS